MPPRPHLTFFSMVLDMFRGPSQIDRLTFFATFSGNDGKTPVSLGRPVTELCNYAARGDILGEGWQRSVQVILVDDSRNAAKRSCSSCLHALSSCTVWPDIIVPLHVPVIEQEMARYN